MVVNGAFLEYKTPSNVMKINDRIEQYKSQLSRLKFDILKIDTN